MYDLICFIRVNLKRINEIKIMKKFILSLSMVIALSSANFVFCADNSKKQESSCCDSTIVAVVGLGCTMIITILGLIASYNQEANQN